MRRLWLLVCVLLMLRVFAARGGEEVTLKTSEIKNPAAVLSKSDAVADRWGQMVKINKGAVLPKGKLGFSASKKEETISLGAESLRLMVQGGLKLVHGSKSRSLKKKGTGLDTEKLKLDSGLRYALAFPYADTKNPRAQTVYFRSGCEQEGRIGPTAVSFYDDNMDGTYTTDDTFSVNGAAVYAPLSALVPTSTAVYKVDGIAANGKTLTVTKHEGDTGKFAAKFSGSSMEAHLAFGSGELNLTSVGKGKTFTVVPGDYELLYGFVYSKKMKKVVAGVSKGNMENATVEAGKQKSLHLGKPFTLIFELQRNGDKVSISPSSIKIRGKAGEVYSPIEIQGVPTVALAKGKKRTGMGAFGMG